MPAKRRSNFFPRFASLTTAPRLFTIIENCRICAIRCILRTARIPICQEAVTPKAKRSECRSIRGKARSIAGAKTKRNPLRMQNPRMTHPALGIPRVANPKVISLPIAPSPRGAVKTAAVKTLTEAPQPFDISSRSIHFLATCAILPLRLIPRLCCAVPLVS